MELINLGVHSVSAPPDSVNMGCHNYLYACFEDCCSDVQFCNNEHQRCQLCETRKQLCFTEDMTPHCSYYCHITFKSDEAGQMLLSSEHDYVENKTLWYKISDCM